MAEQKLTVGEKKYIINRIDAIAKKKIKDINLENKSVNANKRPLHGTAIDQEVVDAFIDGRLKLYSREEILSQFKQAINNAKSYTPQTSQYYPNVGVLQISHFTDTAALNKFNHQRIEKAKVSPLTVKNEKQRIDSIKEAAIAMKDAIMLGEAKDALAKLEAFTTKEF